MIKGGYILKSRAIQDSEIAHAPPHVREIWDYFLRKANYIETKFMGKTINRGELITSYRQISDDLSWKIGFRTERYNKNSIEIAMKWLLKHTMIHTKKTTKGFLVQIVNYNYHQDPNNYEKYNETYNESHMKHTIKPHLIYIKKEKKERNNIYIVDFKNFISLFNSLTHKNFRPTIGLQQKYIVRRKSYSADDLVKAAKSLTSSPFHTGTNDRNTYYATPEFLLRSDEQVDKWLNTEPLYKGKPKIELSEEALKILNKP